MSDLGPEPDRRCPRHIDGDDGPCGRCREAREQHAEWVHHKRALDAEKRARNTREQAALTRAEIARCDTCDELGYTVGGSVCRHDPGAPERAARGLELCRAALAERRRETEL